MTVYTLLLLTALLWGTTPILEKIGLGNLEKTGLHHSAPFIALTIRSLGVAAVLLISLAGLSLAGRGNLKAVLGSIDGKTMLLFVVSGIMAGLLGMWTYFAALKAAATSKIVPIAACYPLITALLSIGILKEQVTGPRLIGTLFIVAGIWLVR